MTIESLTGPARGALSVAQFCSWASIGRTIAYQEIAMGKLRARKVGRRTLIPFAEAQRWLDALPTPLDAFEQQQNDKRALIGR